MIGRRLLPTLLGLALVVAAGAAAARRSAAGRRHPRHRLRFRAAPAAARRRRQPGAGRRYRRGLARQDRPVAVAAQRSSQRSPTGSRELGAAAIGFDVLFPEPDRLGGDNDTQFAAALGATNAVLGFSMSPQRAAARASPPKAGFAISGSDPTPQPAAAARRRRAAASSSPMPRRASAASASTAATSAGTVRQVPLLWSDGTQLYPGLSIETLRLALGVKTLVALGDTRGDGTLEGAARSARSPCPPPPRAISSSTTSCPIRREVISAADAARRRLSRRSSDQIARPHRADRHVGQRPARSPRDAAVANIAGRAASTPR